VHCWVPTADVPDSAPEDLTGLAVAVTAGDRVVGWWLDVAAVLAAGDTGAASRFAHWNAQHSHRVLIGEPWPVSDLLGRLRGVEALAALVDGFAESGFHALGGVELDAAIEAEYDAEQAVSEFVGDAVALFDRQRNSAIAGRWWPPVDHDVTLSAGGTVSVGLDETGMWLEVGIRRLGVTGWSLTDDGVAVVDERGDTHTLDGTAGTVLSRQAAGSAQVDVRRVRYAEVASDTLGVLFDAMDVAARAGRYMLIGVEPGR
jgi:hypothetical protein